MSGNSSLVLCAGTVPDANFKSRVTAAKSAGFNAITLSPQHYLNARDRDKLSAADMQGILGDHDITVVSIDPLLDWFGQDASSAELLMYEAAQAVAAPNINVAPAFAPDIEQTQLVAALVRVCERAAAQGLSVDLEVLPWSTIPNYPALFEVLLAAQQNNAFATLDCLHLYRSGGTVAELRELGRDTLTLISNVQLCDISAQPQAFNWREKLAANKAMLAAGVDGARTMGFKSMLAVSGKAHNTRDDAAVLMKEATCSRLLPGQGDIPLQDILQCLRELDCQPLMGLEISSLTMNRLSPKQATQNAMSAYQKISVSDQASI